MRRRRVCLLAAVGVLALVLQGCDKIPYYFLGNFPGIGPNDEYEASSVVFGRATPFAAGTVQISGQISPLAFVPVPTTVRFFIRQTQPSGAVVASVVLNLTVQPNGVIPDQVVPTPAVTVGTGDRLRFVVQPVGAILPASKLKLKLLYQKS